MERSQLSRKLAVILHADVVGSTGLVQQDEALAHARIQTVFEQFSGTIHSYGGVTRELRGDALVAEFERASDAVIAAIAFQLQNNETNSALNDDIQPALRIGISLGEVIIADNTVTGVGVVLAQRLEQMAESGRVVVQASVSETVPTRLPFDFENLGEHSLKGIDQPVRAYTATLKPGAELPAAEKVPSRAGNKYTAARADDAQSPDLDDKPSIAVLPFNNMSGDPEQDFFADGIAEDITTALSRFYDLLVIARNSSFVYRGSSVDVRQVGNDLDVQYVLEGSVRSAANRVRITAQLVDAHNGNHLWAERFDRSLEDVFEVQDEITALVATAVGRQVDMAEYRSSLRRTDQDLDYRSLCYRAMSHIYKFTAEGCAEARLFAHQVIDQFPQSAGGYSLMAYVHIIELIWGFEKPGNTQAISEAVEFATRAILIDPDDELALTILADVHCMSGKHETAIEECETVLLLNPSFAYAYGILGQVYALSGSTHYQQAVENLDWAIRLSPNDPQLQFYFAMRGYAEFFNADYDAAIDWLHRSVQRNPDLVTPRRTLAATLGLKGDCEKARAALHELMRIEPNCSVADLRQRIAQLFRYPDDFETYLRGLRHAGLPEE